MGGSTQTIKTHFAELHEMSFSAFYVTAICLKRDFLPWWREVKFQCFACLALVIGWTKLLFFINRNCYCEKWIYDSDWEWIRSDGTNQCWIDEKTFIFVEFLFVLMLEHSLFIVQLDTYSNCQKAVTSHSALTTLKIKTFWAILVMTSLSNRNSLNSSLTQNRDRVENIHR